MYAIRSYYVLSLLFSCTAIPVHQPTDNFLAYTVKGDKTLLERVITSYSIHYTKLYEFYSAAAQQENTDITNPVCYPDAEMSHIPKSARIRSYGCGSPVLDAGISLGDTVVDLGCGAGVECYIAARKTGPSGQVIGIDMLDHMLALARTPLGDVAQNLGYGNVSFKKGRNNFV